MRYFLFFTFVLFFYPAAQTVAQDQCITSLNKAENKYEQGKLYEIPALLQPCLKDGFTKEEKIRANRLLTLTYLYLNYYREADSTYLELLKLSPEYQSNDELDPSEIINHHEKFTTKPIYYLTMGKLGLNLSHASVLLDHSISHSGDGSSTYTSNLGFQVGLGAEMVIINNLHLVGEFYLSRKSLHIHDTHWGFYTTDMDISHTEIEFPIMLKYNFWKKKINPFVAAGVNPGFLLQSKMQNIEGFYQFGEERFGVQDRDEIITTKMTKKFNYSLHFGGGINYKIGLNYLVFEARVSAGMLNVTDTKVRWREDFDEGRELKFPVGHVDDDFRISNISFLIGYVRPLYKPRKIK